MNDMNSTLIPKHGDEIREQAAEWLIERQRGLDPARDHRFARWLATSPRHLAEYHALEQLYQELPRVVDSAASVDELLMDLRAANELDERVVPFKAPVRSRTATRHLRPLAFAAMLAAVAVAVVVLWPTMRDQFEPAVRQWDYAAEGQVLVQPLTDDSRLILNANSKARVRYLKDVRSVLLRPGGRLVAEVKPDKRRPFKVYSGPAHVEATDPKSEAKFAVELVPEIAQGTVRVTVLEGHVQVYRDASGDIDLPPVELSANEQIDIVPFEPIPAPSKVDAARELEWANR
jgi:ferric-dicitrate binding protein FerR (iron transport regulator)